MRPFIWMAISLVGLSLIAWAIQPPASIDGRTPLLWVSDDAPTRRLTIDLFNRQHPDLDLRLDPDNGEMEKVIVQSLAGVGPDLFDCYSPNQLAAYVRSGIAWDITDELTKMGIDLKQEAWPVVLAQTMLDGRVYGVPANANANAIWFNKAAFIDKAIPFPNSTTLSTWDQLINLARQMTERDANGHIVRYGLAMEDTDWEQIARNFGGHVFSPDGTRCELNSPPVIRAVQLVQDLINVYHVSASPAEQDAAAQAGGWGSFGMKAMVSGHAAMAIGGRWWLLTLRKDADLRLGACLLPRPPGGELIGGGKTTIINRNSPHRTQALQVIKFMAQVDYNRLLDQEADAVGGIRKYTTDENLFNPKFPYEDFNPVFRSALEDAKPQETSPFVDASTVDHITIAQMDLVRRGAKPAAEAMQTAAKQIDRQIQLALRRDPLLRQRYDQLTAGKNR